MKNSLGLGIAVLLGLAAAALNWIYISQKSRDFEKVAFVGIATDAALRRGDSFREDHFVPVEIPRAGVGELKHFAVLYADRHTVVGMRANQDYGGGELLLRQHLKTPPPELKLRAENEGALWVPVDTKSFVPALLTPGDWVSFLVPVTTPAPPSVDDDAESAEISAINNVEMIGPFRVLSLGNRLGSVEVFKASGAAQLQESVMTVSVRLEKGDLEPKAKKLWTLLQQSNLRQAGVVLHQRHDDQS